MSGLERYLQNKTAEDQKVVFSAVTTLVQKFAARGCAHQNTIQMINPCKLKKSRKAIKILKENSHHQ
jgi:hypothetical protein